MRTRAISKSPREQGSHFYRCPGCDDMVDGRQLTEVLTHHQHVLESYRFRMMRSFERRASKANAEHELTEPKPCPSLGGLGAQ